MALIGDIESLRDFLGYAIVFAPEFPEEDFLDASEQMTLDSMLNELETGLVFVPGMVDDPERRALVRSMLVAAREAYESGDERLGAERLQDLDREIFG
jgi:hypothetical protein